jgi:hypothetical protein
MIQTQSLASTANFMSKSLLSQVVNILSKNGERQSIHTIYPSANPQSTPTTKKEVVIKPAGNKDCDTTTLEIMGLKSTLKAKLDKDSSSSTASLADGAQTFQPPSSDAGKLANNPILQWKWPLATHSLNLFCKIRMIPKPTFVSVACTSLRTLATKIGVSLMLIWELPS